MTLLAFFCCVIFILQLIFSLTEIGDKIWVQSAGTLSCCSVLQFPLDVNIETVTAITSILGLTVPACLAVAVISGSGCSSHLLACVILIGPAEVAINLWPACQSVLLWFHLSRTPPCLSKLYQFDLIVNEARVNYLGTGPGIVKLTRCRGAVFDCLWFGLSREIDGEVLLSFCFLLVVTAARFYGSSFGCICLFDLNNIHRPIVLLDFASVGVLLTIPLPCK